MGGGRGGCSKISWCRASTVLCCRLSSGVGGGPAPTRSSGLTDWYFVVLRGSRAEAAEVRADDAASACTKVMKGECLY